MLAGDAAMNADQVQVAALGLIDGLPDGIIQGIPIEDFTKP